LFSNRADSITRTSSLRGTGSGTEIEIGKAFAARLLSKIRALPENRRGLIPADGFYEWRTIGGMKIPFSIGMKNDSPFAFAGLWEGWKDPTTANWLRTCTIITGDPNELVGQIHTRMPVILPKEHHARWLGETFLSISVLEQWR
jgi:putative SOS response-associated peptidase YedK